MRSAQGVCLSPDGVKSRVIRRTRTALIEHGSVELVGRNLSQCSETVASIEVLMIVSQTHLDDLASQYSQP
jgi:hypothetical protein